MSTEIRKLIPYKYRIVEKLSLYADSIDIKNRIAQETNLSYSTVNRQITIKQSAKSEISLSLIKAFAKTFDCEIDELITKQQ